MSYGSGICSYYGEECHGNLTASGQPFDMNAMTAAHLSLGFGTRIRVTNTRNGKSVDVTINDRGPHVAGRVVDLSKAAFATVENLSAGLFQCTWKVI